MQTVFWQIAETYAFLPREAVTRFLMSCTECQKRMHFNSSGPEPKGGAMQRTGAPEASVRGALPREPRLDWFNFLIINCLLTYLFVREFSPYSPGWLQTVNPPAISSQMLGPTMCAPPHCFLSGFIDVKLLSETNSPSTLPLKA